MFNDNNAARVETVTDRNPLQGFGMIRAMSSLLNRFRFANIAGMGFGGKRDLYTIFGYERNPTPEHYLVKYRRQDVAKRIVEAPADALWTQPPTIKLSRDTQSSGQTSPESSTSSNPATDPNAVGAVAASNLTPEQEAFNTSWKALEGKFPIWSILNRCDRLTAIGRYSCLLIGVKGRVGRSNSMESALTGPLSIDDLIYLQPYGEISCKIHRWDTEPTSPRFGKPLIYEIDHSQSEIQPLGQRAAPAAKLKVHYTRMIHFAEGVLEDEVFGSPRMEAVYNLLDDLLKVSGGTAETFWLTANRGMQLDVDKEMDFDESAAKALTDEVSEYEHQLRRIIRTRGVKINELGSKVPDPSKTFDVLISLISAASGIPKRILLGAEAGQLASDQDRANWAVRVEERRANYGEPVILRPLIKRFSELGILTPVNMFTCIWPEAFRMSPLEKNQAMAQKARTTMNLATAMQQQPDLLDVSEARGIISLGFSDQSLVPPGEDTKTREVKEAPEPGAVRTGDPNEIADDNDDNTGRTDRNNDA